MQAVVEFFMFSKSIFSVRAAFIFSNFRLIGLGGRDPKTQDSSSSIFGYSTKEFPRRDGKTREDKFLGNGKAQRPDKVPLGTRKNSS